MNNKRNNFLLEKGITLVALVVTIIVLLILAGITISMVLGQDGIIQKASDAKQVQEIEQIKEEIQHAWGAVQVDATVDSKDINWMASCLKNELDKTSNSRTRVLNNTDIKVVYKGYETILNVNTGNIANLQKNSSNDDSNNSIQLKVRKLSDAEIRKNSIIKEKDSSAIIEVMQLMTTEELQTINQTQPDKTKNMFAKAFGGPNCTWDDVVSEIYNWDESTVTTIDEAFEHLPPRIPFNDSSFVPPSNAYEYILQSDAYLDEIQEYNYICNNQEKFGKVVYFELDEEKEYEIIAKNDADIVVGSISYNYIIPSTFYIIGKANSTTFEFQRGMTWREYVNSSYNTRFQIRKNS